MGAHGFMGHERLTRDCSLNLTFAEQGQRQIVLILVQHNNIRLFISHEPVMCFHSKAMSCVIPGTVQVISSIQSSLNKQLSLKHLLNNTSEIKETSRVLIFSTTACLQVSCFLQEKI